MCRRRGLKVNAGKSKVMVMNGEERFEQGSHRWGLFRTCLRIQILGFVLDESGTDGTECTRKVASGRRLAVC